MPVFALISDLTAQSRAGYIGLDNWKVGRTAAWAIANICTASCARCGTRVPGCSAGS